MEFQEDVYKVRFSDYSKFSNIIKQFLAIKLKKIIFNLKFMFFLTTHKHVLSSF